MNQKENQAIQFLGKDEALHIDMLEAVRRGEAEIFAAGEHGVLLRHTAGVYEMSAEDEQTAAELLSKVEKVGLFVAHQEFYIEEAKRRLSLRWRTSCQQAAYLRQEPLPVGPQRPELEFRPLTEEFLPFVKQYYSHAMDPEYLRDRLRAGVMVGAFWGGEPAGFIGMHEEGSMGFLEVLPRYRRRGIAEALETDLANRLLAEGKVPYAQVIVGNEASLALQRKLNFTLSSQHVCWLGCA